MVSDKCLFPGALTGGRWHHQAVYEARKGMREDCLSADPHYFLVN